MTSSTRLRFWPGILPPDTDPHPDEPPVALAVGRWEESKGDFCARIAENKSVLKIVLKTKDDHYFLESWIRHHERIVGLSNLIIFDNMSSNERVRRTYARYQDSVSIIQFEGNHNRLHSTVDYPELYEALERSCQFFVFLDTDEFLILVDGPTYRCDESILELLQAREDADVFPASWLMNEPRRDRIFMTGGSLEHFGPRLAFGKPIVRSRARIRGYINHNIMLGPSSFSGIVTPNFFLLHLTNLFPQQRIDVTMNKLRKLGVASPEDTPATIGAKDIGAVAEERKRLLAQKWIEEMQEQVARSKRKANAEVPKDRIELGEGGEIRYHGTPAADALNAFLTDAQPFIHAVLETDLGELRNAPFERLKEQWSERARRWGNDRRVNSLQAIEAADSPKNAGAAVASQGDRLEITGGHASRARLLAFYLPQFYPIPENNRWWGAGFTEWANVVRTRPLFPGHYQPHLPAHLGFYDLRVPEVREAQADLARRHGIEGFCYWHYWFHGKRLLERPFEEVLASGRPDFPFCLSWANETWSRRWHGTGAAAEVLQEQRYSPEDDLRHIQWLMGAFADSRYITVKGRPLFFIYKPGELPDPRRTTDVFRTESVRHGLHEPFLVGCNSHADRDYRDLGFDCTLEFEPQLGLLPGPTDPGLKRYDYAAARRLMTRRRRDYPTIPCIFVQWDNTPRRAGNGIVFTDSTPAEFESGLADLVRGCMHKSPDERVVIINAWNEWAEGNHLEPDLKHGLAYLEAVKRVNGRSPF